MSSPAWFAKRRLILARDPKCGVCKWRDSTEAHHLSYSNLGDEPLEDLMGVCHECHQKLHKPKCA